MIKKIVNCKKEEYTAIPVGGRALVTPVNHPDSDNVSNTCPVLTSTVVAYDEETGEFGGLTPKQAWWAGYRVGKNLPPDMSRSEAVASPPGQPESLKRWNWVD